MLLVFFVVNFLALDTYNMEIIYVVRKFSGNLNRINFWHVKILWSWEHHYVAISNMAVWKRLVCLTPDG